MPRRRSTTTTHSAVWRRTIAKLDAAFEAVYGTQRLRWPRTPKYRPADEFERGGEPYVVATLLDALALRNDFVATRDFLAVCGVGRRPPRGARWRALCVCTPTGDTASLTMIAALGPPSQVAEVREELAQLPTAARAVGEVVARAAPTLSEWRALLRHLETLLPPAATAREGRPACALDLFLDYLLTVTSPPPAVANEVAAARTWRWLQRQAH